MRTLHFLFICLLCSCSRQDATLVKPLPTAGADREYIIPAGQHYANYNPFQPTNYGSLKFSVRFDSSAVYQTVDPANQEDINKLYGFSDNNAEHQQYSARFGWNWARNALRLYAYVYNNGERNWQEIVTLQPGREYHCAITVSGSKYIFTAGDAKVEMYRASSTATASGYQLYPYFGGDETAPHDIHIRIKPE